MWKIVFLEVSKGRPHAPHYFHCGFDFWLKDDELTPAEKLAAIQ